MAEAGYVEALRKGSTKSEKESEYDEDSDESKDLKVTFTEQLTEEIFDKFIDGMRFRHFVDYAHATKFFVILTLKDRSLMLELHNAVQTRLQEFKIENTQPVISERVRVTFKGILKARCFCAPITTECLKIFGFKSRTRIAEFSREEFFKNPLKSYVRIGRKVVFVRYYGQIETCRICSMSGHKQDKCPKRIITRNSGPPKHRNATIRGVDVNQAAIQIPRSSEGIRADHDDAANQQGSKTVQVANQTPRNFETSMTDYGDAAVQEGSITTNAVNQPPSSSESSTTDDYDDTAALQEPIPETPTTETILCPTTRLDIPPKIPPCNEVIGGNESQVPGEVVQHSYEIEYPALWHTIDTEVQLGEEIASSSPLKRKLSNNSQNETAQSKKVPPPLPPRAHSPS